jgi:hypothetical protein
LASREGFACCKTLYTSIPLFLAKLVSPIYRCFTE